jgi:predicted Rossmann fold flavoprotein
MTDLIVVGGGAAGFFAAIEVASRKPEYQIVILEKSNKLLAKVRISGGGRCNVTHHSLDPSSLASHYPRGRKELKQLFSIFQATDTIRWFAKHGVELKTEADGRMFPVTNDSQSVIDCFLRGAEKSGIEIITSAEVSQVDKLKGAFTVRCRNGKVFSSRKLLIAMGGHPQSTAYAWIQSLGHTILPPIPSLFTFNDPSREFAELMGVAVEDAEVKIAGSKFSSRGPVLITHWGLSGPAVIRLSAWAAQYLHETNYRFVVLVNWTGAQTEESIRLIFREKTRLEGGRRIGHPLFEIPSRLWDKLCVKAGIIDGMVWAETPAKMLNRLMEFLIRCPMEINGKTTFKEEFVTCGGVDIKEIDLSTMQSKKVAGLYFAGEVLNVDGETGGFNFQAAWTTAYVASSAISDSD